MEILVGRVSVLYSTLLMIFFFLDPKKKNGVGKIPNTFWTGYVEVEIQGRIHNRISDVY